MPNTKKATFKARCEQAARELNLEVVFLDEDRNMEPFEDDGNLHITKDGIRAVFDVQNGQSLNGAEQNENTRKVLTLMKLTKYINDQTLVEEDEEEDEVCPHCGR